jgi:hypothetical protein
MSGQHALNERNRMQEERSMLIEDASNWRRIAEERGLVIKGLQRELRDANEEIEALEEYCK